jgi:hypothetical protein
VSDPRGRRRWQFLILRIEPPQVFLTSGNFSHLATSSPLEMNALHLATELH